MTHEQETYTVATETIHLVNKSLSNLVQATANPYERHSAAAALQEFTFLVAQRLRVAKAVLVSRSSSQRKISYTAKALQTFARVKHR